MSHFYLTGIELKGGYWDQNIRTPGDFLTRDGGTPYRDAWDQIDRSTVHRVYVESRNEYDEGTGIYAAQNAPYIAPANTGGKTDTWSATSDPFEYIKTTARGAASFNDVPEQDAKILWHNIPATLTPGESRTATVIVRNTGDASWTAAMSYKLGQGDADSAFVQGKRVLIDDQQDEIPLYGGIFRGRVKAFVMTLTAPSSPGIHTTHWRMVREGEGFFGEELVVSVEVKEKIPASVVLGNRLQLGDGGPRSVSVTTDPVGLSVDVTYDGSPYPPTGPGTYTVVGTINDPDYAGSATETLAVIADPNRVAVAGGFETQNASASFASPPDSIDATVFPGWRVFNVDSAKLAFSATIVGNAAQGSRAMRLEVNNTNAGANFALDQWQPTAHIPVEQLSDFTVSFEAVWNAGATADNLLFQVQEFDSTGAYLTNGLSGLISVGSTGYQTHSFTYRPSNPSTVGVGLFFSPMRGVNGTTTITLDNFQFVKMSEAIPPVILAQPSSQSVTAGSGVTLAVDASGMGPFSFQWLHEGTPLPGATTSTYHLPSPQRFHAGSYTVEVTNAFGVRASEAAVLSVNSPGPNSARLLNLSTRAVALTGSNALIPGFVISGAGSKALLIRAVGATLRQAPFNLPTALEDPKMTLMFWNGSGFEVVATNDNWETNANAGQIAQATLELGAFGLTDGRDAALYAELVAGRYTVVARGVNDLTGVAIVELYDDDDDPAGSVLSNISNRGFVGTGSSIMIPGLTVSAEGPKTFLMRAVGPALGEEPFNLAGVLADSKMSVFSGQTAILTNDNWGDNPDAAYTAQVAADLGAFPLSDGSKDAAFVVTLPPGNYTIHASGVGGATGTALVEVYVVE